MGSGVVCASGAKIDSLQPHLDPDLPHEGAYRGFAIGAGDGNHGLRLRAVPQGCRARQRLAGGIGDDKGHVSLCQRVSGQRGSLGVGQHRHRAHAQRILDKLGPVDLAAGHGGEQGSGLDLTAVDADTCNGRVAPPFRGQTKGG